MCFHSLRTLILSPDPELSTPTESRHTTCPLGGKSPSVKLTSSREIVAIDSCFVDIFHQSFLWFLRHTDEPQKGPNSCLWLQSRSVLSSFGVVLMSCRFNFHVVRSALQYSAINHDDLSVGGEGKSMLIGVNAHI